MWYIVRIVFCFCLSLLAVPLQAQWRLFDVQGGVRAVIKAPSSSRHIVVTAGDFGCMKYQLPNGDCGFVNVYSQSDSILRKELSMFDMDSGEIGGAYGTSFRTAYAGDQGIVLFCDPDDGLYHRTFMLVMPNGADTFRRVYGDSVAVEHVCRNSSIYGLSRGYLTGMRLFHLFSGEVSPEIRPRFYRGGREEAGGYLTIPPSDSVGFWRVSEDCGQEVVPYVVPGIPGQEIVSITTYPESHVVAMMRDSVRYITYDRARSWLRIPPPPAEYMTMGFTARLEHFTDDSVMVLCLGKDTTEVLVYRALGGETWQELPKAPFPSLSYIGGSSIYRLYVARTPSPVIRPPFGAVTDVVGTNLALLDPTAGVIDTVRRPVMTKRMIHRGDRLSFSEDKEWTLYAIDGAIVDRGRSSSIPFDVVPGMYVVVKSGERMMVAVAP